jgi:glycosyltransferase involved in cell wall biosynthesis
VSRVLLLVRRLWNGGGTETYVYTLAKELQKMGYTVGIFTTGGPWVSYFRKNGIQVHISSAYNQNCIFALERVIKQNLYTVLHAMDTFSFYLVRGLKKQRIRNIHTVFTIHGRYVHRQALVLCAPFARALIVVSPSLRNYVIHCGVSAQKVHLIANGISVSTFHPANNTNYTLRENFRLQSGIPEGAFVIGYAGRFTFNKAILGKRIYSVLRSFANLHPDTRVLIAGRQSKAMVLPAKNSFILGHVSNMENFYHACDVVIGTARVALESLACAKPTIAVGNAKHIGILNPANLDSSFHSNFGDHGAIRSSWTNQELLQDLTLVHDNYNFYLNKSLVLSQIVSTRYSASSMAQQTLQLYR